MINRSQMYICRLVVGTVRISKLEKQNVDYMIEKLNNLKGTQIPASAIAN